ncbi:MAG TPA: ABC transporter permease [Candidatus Limnocylindrales bacterium]|nr:ABC transporter permease [Candidatus Limnocylindrales bacterium]
MTAPAVPATPAAPTAARRPRAKAGIDRWAGLVEFWLRAHTSLVYTFLYLPIVIVVLFSFNENQLATIWTGFSLRWYEVALNDQVVQSALLNSFSVALPNAILATLFGTMAALGLQRVGRRTRMGFDALTYISIIVPEIVIALSTLVLFASAFGFINDAAGTRLQLGIPTIIAAHMLFNISIVLLLVRARLTGMDRTMVEASYDLYATPWRTFRQITFPQLLPAIIAGFLLAFTFSFDDYVITSFVSGPGSSTLPIFVFGQVKRGVTPETNAVATMMLLFTLLMLAVGQLVLSRQARKSGGVQTGGMAGMIAEQR